MQVPELLHWPAVMIELPLQRVQAVPALRVRTQPPSASQYGRPQAESPMLYLQTPVQQFCRHFPVLHS
jgi:hypothetical protein